MARSFGKLSSLAVGRAKEPGLYGDGGGLYLQISKGGSRSWIFRYKTSGRSRYAGLGPEHTITLAEARAKATDARRLLLEGKDPIETRRAALVAARLEEAKALTFRNGALWSRLAHRDALRFC